MNTTWDQQFEAARQELLDARYDVQVKRRDLRKAQERLTVATVEFDKMRLSQEVSS